MKVISLDCETNGLGGQAFALGATASDDDGQEIETVTARCPIAGPVDPWVDENVLPALDDVPVTHADYAALLREWDTWYGRIRSHWPDVVVVGHVIWPVEARFLSDVYADDLFAGPYPLLDVAPLLLAAGHDPTSVDGYLDAHGLPVPEGSPHHPLYGARAAATAFRHLMTNFQRARTAYRMPPVAGR